MSATSMIKDQRETCVGLSRFWNHEENPFCHLVHLRVIKQINFRGFLSCLRKDVNKFKPPPIMVSLTVKLTCQAFLIGVTLNLCTCSASGPMKFSSRILISAHGPKKVSISDTVTLGGRGYSVYWRD